MGYVHAPTISFVVFAASIFTLSNLVLLFVKLYNKRLSFNRFHNWSAATAIRNISSNKYYLTTNLRIRVRYSIKKKGSEILKKS